MGLEEKGRYWPGWEEGVEPLYPGVYPLHQHHNEFEPGLQDFHAETPVPFGKAYWRVGNGGYPGFDPGESVGYGVRDVVGPGAEDVEGTAGKEQKWEDLEAGEPPLPQVRSVPQVGPRAVAPEGVIHLRRRVRLPILLGLLSHNPLGEPQVGVQSPAQAPSGVHPTSITDPCSAGART